MATSIFISLDGMTDPLGQSQVLPYLSGLSKNHRIILISAEKPARFEAQKNIIHQICITNNIEWCPVIYKNKIPLLSQIINFLKLLFKTIKLSFKNKPQILHARSYVPALVAYLVSLFVSAKILFDMRGFWANERIDGEIWNMNSLKGKLLFNFFKRIEKLLIKKSAAIITLTDAAKKEIEHWDFYNKKTSITVIPCCVDTQHFNYENVQDEKQQYWRNKLNIPNDLSIVTYLGSIGTWYMLPEMLAFFKEQLSKDPKAIFLFITPEPKEIIYQESVKLDIPESNIRVVFGKRADVPNLLALSTYSLFFIKPLYSKIGSSPTKLAELLAMGVPVIANGNVGDIDQIFNKNKCGLIVEDFTQKSYAKTISKINDLKSFSPKSLRDICLNEFSLSLGLDRYNEVYSKLAS